MTVPADAASSAAALVGLVLTTIAVDQPEVVADVVSIDRSWLVVGAGLVGTLISAPWIVAVIHWRENKKLLSANADKADSESSDARASADLKRQQVVDSLFAALERRIEDQDEVIHDQAAELKQLRDQQRRDTEARLVHAAWDFIARDRLDQCGVDLPPVPPLQGQLVV